MSEKRDWLAASDLAAHLMDALERELIKVSFRQPSKLQTIIMVSFGFEGHDYECAGVLTYTISTRDWHLEVNARVGNGRNDVRTRDVPRWIVDGLSDETKAMILAETISNQPPIDDIPF